MFIINYEDITDAPLRNELAKNFKNSKYRSLNTVCFKPLPSYTCQGKEKGDGFYLTDSKKKKPMKMIEHTKKTPMYTNKNVKKTTLRTICRRNTNELSNSVKPDVLYHL